MLYVAIIYMQALKVYGRGANGPRRWTSSLGGVSSLISHLSKDHLGCRVHELHHVPGVKDLTVNPY